MNTPNNLMDVICDSLTIEQLESLIEKKKQLPNLVDSDEVIKQQMKEWLVSSGKLFAPIIQ